MNRSGVDGEVNRLKLREEIDQTRAELGHTVQQLAERADVKARVRAARVRTTERVRGSVRDAARTPLPWLMLAAGTAAVLAAVVLAMRGRRR